MRQDISLSQITDRLLSDFTYIKFKILPSLLLLSVLSLIFFILNILDGHSTYRVVSLGSYKNEKNPIARYVIKKWGAFKGILIIKSISLIAVFSMLFKYGKVITRDFNIIMFITDIFYTWVVVHNYRNLFRMIDRQEKFLKKYKNVL